MTQENVYCLIKVKTYHVIDRATGMKNNLQDIETKQKNNNSHDEKSCSGCTINFFEEKPPLWKRQKIIIGVISAILLVSGLILESLTSLHIVAQIVFLSVVAVAGRDILKKAWFFISRWRLDMNCLMSIAALGPFLIGHGEEGAAVIFLFFYRRVFGGLCC